MNKVANLVKFYNRKASDIIKDVYQGYNHYPYSFREMLKKHGNEMITSIVIVRSPLSNILHQILNSLTLGHLENRLNEYDYNSLFHLKVIINNKYCDDLDKYTLGFKFCQVILKIFLDVFVV